MGLLLEKIIGSVTLGLVIAIEFNHSFIEQIPWAGFTVFANNFSPILIMLWAISLVALWIEESILIFFQVLGLLSLCVQSLLLLIGSNKIVGLFYFTAFVASSVISYLVITHKNKRRQIYI